MTHAFALVEASGKLTAGGLVAVIAGVLAGILFGVGIGYLKWTGVRKERNKRNSRNSLRR